MTPNSEKYPETNQDETEKNEHLTDIIDVLTTIHMIRLEFVTHIDAPLRKDVRPVAKQLLRTDSTLENSAILRTDLYNLLQLLLAQLLLDWSDPEISRTAERLMTAFGTDSNIRWPDFDIGVSRSMVMSHEVGCTC